MKRKFKIIRHFTKQEADMFKRGVLERGVFGLSKHVVVDRYDRYSGMEAKARPLYGYCALVDRGHEKGLEVHMLCVDGYMRIYSYRDYKLCTTYVPTIRQVYRIKDNSGKMKHQIIPNFIYKKCSDYNRWKECSDVRKLPQTYAL